MRPTNNYPSTEYKYPYKWAENIVQRFLEMYGRGTDFVCREADFDKYSLKNYLIKCIRKDNQIQWEAMKLLIKAAQRGDLENRLRTVENKREYLKFVKREFQGKAIEMLEKWPVGY